MRAYDSVKSAPNGFPRFPLNTTASMMAKNLLPAPRIFVFVLSCLASACVGVSTVSGEPQTPVFRVRAIWIDPGSFATKEAADATLQRCHRAGFNVLLPDVMVNQSIAFKSGHFHGKVLSDERFDPLDYLLQGAHARGMKVEAWCCVYYEGAGAIGKPPLDPKWLVESMGGRPFEQRFLSPSIPAVNEYLLSVIADLCKYDVDGVHLDYIRYPGTSFDYSPAGRRGFIAEAGFDPGDFLDHADRLLEGTKELYPIRVLYPADFPDKPWETTSVERTLDQFHLGYAFVSESPQSVAQLKAPGLLIVSSYYDPPVEMIAALSDFVRRGGDILWTDAPGKGLSKSPQLRRLLGLRSATWKGKVRTAFVSPESAVLAIEAPTDSFTTTSAYDLFSEGAVAALNSPGGGAAATVAEEGGRVVVVGPHLMKSTSPVAAKAVAAVVDWLRADLPSAGEDVLSAKRKAWIDWRADRVTQLVRAVHDVAQSHSPPIAVSSSGGPSPVERFACYRDARRWLAEGLNDHVFPMNYTDDSKELTEILQVQSSAIPPGRKSSVYPGLQAYNRVLEEGRPMVSSLSAQVVKRQLEVVRAQGYSGFALFAYNTIDDEILEVVRQFSESSPIEAPASESHK